MGISTVWNQIYPPTPAFTELNIQSLAGKVYLVTGANRGIGLQIAKILYLKGGTVYIACRSESKASDAMSLIKSSSTSSTGQVKFLQLDLSDLDSVKKAAEVFLKLEMRLDVLFNSAGISLMPAGSVTKHGHAMTIGTNCLGPYLLTTLLTPLLQNTAATSPEGSVRIVFTSSVIVEQSPPGGLVLSELSKTDFTKAEQQHLYSMTKSGNWFLASEFSRHLSKDGIVSLAINPGNCHNDGYKKMDLVLRYLMKLTLHDPKFGAYTNLWAALSPNVSIKDGGRYAVPWGAWHPNPRLDLLASLKSEQEGGTGLAGEFWAWCEKECEQWL